MSTVEHGHAPVGALCSECSWIPPQLFLPGHASKFEIKSINFHDRRCHLYLLLSGTIGADTRAGQQRKLTLRSEWRRSELACYGGWLAVYEDEKRLCRLRFTMDYIDEPYQTLPSIYQKARQDSLPDSVNRPWLARPQPRFQPLSSSSDSSENFALMNHWLDVCMENHHSCKLDGIHVDQAGFVLPTRLIQLGVDNGSIRLIPSAALPRNAEGFGPPYCTLSHRWGDPNDVPKSTVTTVATLMENISFDSLPKTFQDAITVTRKVGVQYLWIDSLCIIQDDVEDVIKELAQMHRIYSMGICLLVAAAAADSKGGCFVRRTGQETSMFSINMKQGETDFKVTLYPYLNDFLDAVSNGPVSSRGWCFQERQLAKRVIYFTERCIAWECRSAVATEDHPDMTERRWYDAQAKFQNGSNRLLDCLPASVDITRPSWLAEERTRSYLLRAEPVRMVGRGFNEQHRHWMRKWGPIVEEYSSRALSHQSDRLPALGGLAALISTLLETPSDSQRHLYLAGLFRTDLLRQLCWFPDVQDPRSRRAVDEWPLPPRDAPACTKRTISETPTLPSWSWLSVDRPVCYYGFDEFSTETEYDPDEQGRPLTENLKLGDMGPHVGECRVDLVMASYPFGGVSAGLVTLTGRMLQVTISEVDHVSHINTPVLPKCYRIFKNSTHQTDPLWQDPVVIVSEEGVIYFDTDPKSLPETTVFCFRLGTTQSMVTASKPVDVGLVLLEVKGSETPGGLIAGKRFRRVGMYEMRAYHSKYLEKAEIKTVCMI